MKVYVVNEDWAFDGDCQASYRSGVAGVYTSQEQAIEELGRLVGKAREDFNDFEGYEFEQTATSFVAWEPEYFAPAHYCAWVSERELEGE